VVEFQKQCVQWAEEEMLWTIVAVLLIIWLLGFSLSIGGSLIHTGRDLGGFRHQPDEWAARRGLSIGRVRRRWYRECLPSPGICPPERKTRYGRRLPRNPGGRL
jgi:Family of unknown function (DUF5670)